MTYDFYTDLPFEFERLQFPIKVYFVVGITKAQDQTFKYAGIDLSSECFSYGQLYVGRSRTHKFEMTFILLPYTRENQRYYLF